MIPHQTSVPRRDPSSAGNCAQSKRSAAVTELENAVAHFQATLTDEDRNVVQQFTPIIDTYIQSNPDISAIIWSSIKLTFMFLANFLLTFARQALVNQFWKAITGSFQTELKTYVDNVKAKAEDAQCEIELAKAQADYQEQQQQTKERQNASDYRQQLSAWATKYSAAMKDLQDLKEKHCKDKKKVKLINELTSYNSMPTLNSMRNKRHMGTAEWCFHTPEYKGWANANKSAILHITGKISRRFTSFFFLRFDESKSLSSSTVIRSCLQQLLASPLIETLDSGAMADLDISLQEAKSSLFSAASLSSLFTTASRNLDDWFIVIDGLDEVDIIRQIGLLKFLREVLDQLPEPHRIKLLLSSREASSSDIDRILPQVTRLYTGLKPTSADIRLYTEDIISNKISTDELIVNDPGLENDIIETIHRKEKGMFLWVFLTINDICSRKSDKDIRRALQDIPGDLHATFDRTLGRIAAKKNNTAIVQKAFTLIQASFEPLTLDQLREALSVDIGQQTLDRDDLISGVDRLPMCHHSIQKYLLIPSSEDLTELHLERDKCDRFMGELCVTYISLDNFQRALGFTRKRNTDSSHMDINMGGLAEQTIRTAVGDSIGSLIGRFTREAVRPSHTTSPGKVQWNGSRLSSVPKHNFGPSQSSEQYTFFEYASKHWYKHQLCIDSNDNEATWRLLGQILRRPHQHSQGEPWFQPAWKKAVSETIGNDVLFFGPGFDSYRETAVSLETDENGRLMNTSTLRDLCYVFIYAIQKRNTGLACRVFMLLVEDYKRPANRRLHGYLSIIINRMARFDVKLMLLSKTSFGRSFFDILIEGALTDMQRMQVFLSERLYTKERPRDHDNGLFGLLGKSDETEHIRLQRQLDNTLTFLGAVQAAATHGIEAIENSLAHCLDTGGSVPLHKATITLLFDKILLRNRWPTSICEGIVRVFFGESLMPGYEEASETVHSRAVHSNSWELASSLIDIQPVSTDEREAVGDFSYIKHALRCRDCRGIAMQMPKPRKKWSFDLRTNRCIKYGVQCPGYRDGLLFRSQLNPTNFRKGDKNHGTLEQSTSPSPSSSSLLSCSSLQATDSVPRSMHQHWTLHSIPIFLNVYSTLPLFYDMYRNIGDGPLLSATHLFSRAYVTVLRQPTAKYNTSMIENDQELTTQLGKTLTSVRSALAQPGGAYRDDLLATIWILANYEASSLLVGSGKRPDQSRTWNLHTQGLYSILKLRGSEWLRMTTSRTVFWLALNMAQIHSLSSNTECPQELEEWFVIIKEKMLPREAMVLHVSSFIFKACQVQARIFKILSSCDYDAARIAFYDIVASIRDARQELRAFAESPRTAIGLFDTYMGNLYAGTCIKVYSLLMALACFLSHQRPLSIPLDVLRSTRNQCINVTQNSAQNVLDTLSRALDTRAGPEMSPKTFFDAVKLVWPLRAIHAMPATSPEQKRVAAETLAFLGRDIGLKQALNIYTDFYEPLPVEARTILEVDGDPLDELQRLMS
ncbi:vegetative incompatibility protein het-E-1 [Fusarium bulbicola]|nr:vegetative incompatibility protein het-E-1 [Fusarium bulbicola]